MKSESGIAKESLFGVDVAVSRADDLDKLLLVHIKESGNPLVLDLGCGQGGQSFRMVDAGARVTGIDIHSHGALFAAYRSKSGLSETSLQYIQGDARQFASLTEHMNFDLCCVQRMLHYLPYDDAKELLKSLKQSVTGALYVSVTGIESEIGATYVDKENSVAERFCTLSADAAETFSITESVCLYTQAEFVELLTTAGWSIEKIWTSAFGNHKAICR